MGHLCDAGVGLPSMLCAALGAKAVTLTDYDPQVIRSCLCQAFVHACLCCHVAK